MQAIGQLHHIYKTLGMTYRLLLVAVVYLCAYMTGVAETPQPQYDKTFGSPLPSHRALRLAIWLPSPAPKTPIPSTAMQAYAYGMQSRGST